MDYTAIIPHYTILYIHTYYTILYHIYIYIIILYIYTYTHTIYIYIMTMGIIPKSSFLPRLQLDQGGDGHVISWGGDDEPQMIDPTLRIRRLGR